MTGTFRTYWTAILLAAVLAAGAAGAQALGDVEEAGLESHPAQCQAACSDARSTCQKARTVAHRRCARGCRDTIQEATRQARAICEAEELPEQACRQLVQQTVEGAQMACHADCRVGAKLQRSVCRAERRECRNACLAEIDPECREPCVADFQACRDDLAACANVCGEQRDAAAAACHEQVAEVCDPVVLRECLRQVREDAWACVEECRLDTSCGEDLRECVGDCAETP
jgi:hypothetical protein